MSLFQLIYISTATAAVTTDAAADENLEHILKISRHRNALNAVTGMLLFSGRHFMQVLEGARYAVEEIFHSIEMDPRHFDVAVISRRAIPARNFIHWSMGFARVPSLLDFADTFQIEKEAISARVVDANDDVIRGAMATFNLMSAGVRT